MTLEEQLRAIVRDELARVLAERERQPEMVTPADYAKRWSISVSTVRAAIREGRLPFERVGRAVRIDAEARIRSGGAKRDAAANARLKLLRGGKNG